MSAEPTVVSAPGKLMIAGEYAVLRGAPALVCAVDRRVRVTLGAAVPSDAVPPEAEAARSAAEAVRGAVGGGLAIDATALRSADQQVKLGLGSSAAAAAGTAAAVFGATGADLSDHDTKTSIFKAALKGHSAIAPNGSGADVAASVFGGFLQFSKHGTEASASPIAFPEGLISKVVWTGSPARTSDFLSRIKDLEASDPFEAGKRLEGIEIAASAMLRSLEAADSAAFFAATSAHHEAMRALGDAANAPIVEERLGLAHALAKEAGGAAKPSGAGGGDAAIAFFDQDDAATAFTKACAKHGLALLSLQLGTDGVVLA